MNIFQKQLLFNNGKTMAEEGRKLGWIKENEPIELPSQKVSIEEFEKDR